MSDDLRNTAFHEAGHAVAAVKLDLAFSVATIVPSADGHDMGSVDTNNPLVGWQRGDGSRHQLGETWCLSLYAGWAAEVECLGRSPSAAGDEHESADFSAADRCIAEHMRVPGRQFAYDEASDIFARRLQEKARRLVAMNRRAVAAVAEALLERQTLTAEEIRAIVAAA